LDFEKKKEKKRKIKKGREKKIVRTDGKKMSQIRPLNFHTGRCFSQARSSSSSLERDDS